MSTYFFVIRPILYSLFRTICRPLILLHFQPHTPSELMVYLWKNAAGNVKKWPKSKLCEIR